MVRHLAAFLHVLPPDFREQYLSVISDVTNETSNWRFRKLMARYVLVCSYICLCPMLYRQLGALSMLYGPEIVADRLVPISVQLCQDSVAGVRRVANREASDVLNSKAANEKHLLSGRPAHKPAGRSSWWSKKTGRVHSTNCFPGLYVCGILLRWQTNVGYTKALLITHLFCFPVSHRYAVTYLHRYLSAAFANIFCLVCCCWLVIVSRMFVWLSPRC